MEVSGVTAVIQADPTLGLRKGLIGVRAAQVGPACFLLTLCRGFFKPVLHMERTCCLYYRTKGSGLCALVHAWCRGTQTMGLINLPFEAQKDCGVALIPKQRGRRAG
jgi:hypothetical protein